MKISDLIKFRNTLQESVNSLCLTQPINNVCTILESSITSNKNIDASFTVPIVNYTSQIQQLLTDSNLIIDEIEHYIADITQHIDSLADNQYGEEYKQNWHKRFKTGFMREFFVTQDINKLVRTRISQYIDWHYPVLQFGCRYNGQEPKKPKENFKTLGGRQNDPDIFLELTDGMSGGEPLFVCDFDAESMQRCVLKFTPEYQSKICQYVINDSDFSALPQQQFSFILCWNMFNYATIEVIEQYLKELTKLLRPGGVILLSYNNCDLMESMLITELGATSYMPKRHLVQLCNKLGFELLASYDLVNEVDPIPFTHISWIEIKKPGELSTVKLHTVLGQIIIKN